MLDSASKTVAISLFVVLFPIFFVYHLAAAADFIPYFFGQWWSHWNFIGAGLFSLIMISRWQEARWWELAAAALVSIIIAYASFHYLRGETWQRTPNLALESAKLAAGLICLYGTGRFLRFSSSLTNVILAAWAILSVATLVLMDPSSYSFIATYRLNAPDAATYQWFGQAYAFTSLAALSFAPDRKTAATVAGVTLPVLFVLSSRSDLLAFSVVLALWAGLRIFAPAPRRQLSVVALSGLVFASTVLVILALGQLLPRDLRPAVAETAALATASVPGEPVGANRNVELLDIEESGSFQQRQEMLANGWGDIVRSPITGVYAGQVISGGRFGAYIHNALSTWHNYGLVSFALYLALSFGALLVAFRAVVLQGDRSAQWQFALYTSIFVTVSILATKSVYWPLPALVWGLVAGLSHPTWKPIQVPTASPVTVTASE